MRNLRRPRIAAAAKPNSAIIGGAGTSVPLLLPEVDELVDDEVELDVEVEEEVELDVLVEDELPVLVVTLPLEVETSPVEVETLPVEVETSPVEVEIDPVEVEVDVPPVEVVVETSTITSGVAPAARSTDVPTQPARSLPAEQCQRSGQLSGFVTMAIAVAKLAIRSGFSAKPAAPSSAS